MFGVKSEQINHQIIVKSEVPKQQLAYIFLRIAARPF